MSDITVEAEFVNRRFTVADPPSVRARALKDQGVKPIRGYNERIWMNFLREQHSLEGYGGGMDEFLHQRYGLQDVPLEAKELALKWQATGLFEDFEIRAEYYDPALFGILEGKRYLLAKWGSAQDWSWLRRYRQANQNWWDDRVAAGTTFQQIWALAVVLVIPSMASAMAMLVLLMVGAGFLVGGVEVALLTTTFFWTTVTLMGSAMMSFGNIFGWFPMPLRKKV